MKFLKAIRNGCLIPLIILVSLGWISINLIVSYSWKGAIPKDIALGRKLHSETPLIGSPGGSAGYAAFRLKSSAISQINKKGLSYFDDKTFARRWESKVDWVETGTGKSLSRAYISFGLNTTVNQKDEKIIREALKNSGNYYGSLEKNTRILIIPEKRMLVVGYWD